MRKLLETTIYVTGYAGWLAAANAVGKNLYIQIVLIFALLAYFYTVNILICNNCTRKRG